MKIKIACYGSCITRDNFNSKLNPDYKRIYECVATSEHSSLISMVAPRVEYDDAKLDFTLSENSPRNKEIAIKDFDRSFLNDLVKTQPDYLIMDFFPDVFFGVVFSEDKIMTKNDWYLCNTTFYNELPNKFILKLDQNSQEYLSVWIPALINFMNFMEKNVPDCQVIINKARFSNRILDDDSVYLLPSLDKYNEIWNVLDNYVISKYGLKSIELDHSEYYLAKNPTLGWKIFHLHYLDNYYHDFLKSLNKLVI
ncbi:hypothetical protein HA450_00095 [Xanthomonas citri pv. punicae]|nr:hypothetical protein [Xanthomonas citri pv. punicae]